MTTKSQARLFGFTPAHYGIASVVAGCLAYAMLWGIFNQGPDGVFNSQLSSFAVSILLLFGFACGLLGLGTGINHKQWFGSITGVIGVAIAGIGARIVLGF